MNYLYFFSKLILNFVSNSAVRFIDYELLINQNQKKECT